MKVKKYIGDTMQDTIFKVKAELGPDAIIINTRKIKKGGFLGFFAKKQVEILAALEEEKKEDLQTLQEINNLKDMINSMQEQFQADVFFNNLDEELAVVYTHLNQQGINLEIVRKIIDRIKEEQWQDFSSLLQVVEENLIGEIGYDQPIKINPGRKVVAFAGPTGVGKTTTIAKLAARFALDLQKKVALITTDTYRIAAVQQLRTYSDILNIPLKVVYNADELSTVIKNNFNDYDLILIDTAGSSWNDKIQMGRLQKIANHKLVDEVHLLVGLDVKSNVLDSVIDHFSPLNPAKLILTKMDETMTFGDIINLKKKYDLPYSYITFGQDVPDDIREASPDFLVEYIMGDLYE